MGLTLYKQQQRRLHTALLKAFNNVTATEMSSHSISKTTHIDATATELLSHIISETTDLCDLFTQAHASKLAKDPEAQDNRFKGFDEFMASAKAQAATKIEPAPETQVTAQAEEEDQPYSPSQGAGSGDPDQPDLINLIASSDSLPRKEVGLMSKCQAGFMCCT